MSETPWSNLAVAPVAWSLLAAGILLLIRGAVWRRSVATVACLGQLALAGVLVTMTSDGSRLVLGLGGWAPPLGIVLVVDLLAAIMLALSAVMACACHLYSFAETGSKEEHPLRLSLWQFLLAGINLSFVTGDLFNLFVAFELMLIASYALLTLEADDWDVKQAYPYVALNLVGGGLFLLAVGFVYGVFGTLNMAHLSQRMAEAPDHPAVLLAGLLLFAVFALKAGIFPLYYWLPNSYPILAAPLGAFYAGMLTKVGVYVLLRIYGTVFPHSLHGLYQLMGWLAALTMVLAVLGAVSRGFVRGILSWHILSQIGYMVLAIGLFTRMAIAACIYYIVHHIVVKATLFLAGAAAARRCGGSDDLERVGGVARVSPWLAACFFLQAMSLAGVPPLSGFWGKFIIIVEGVRAQQWVWVAAAVVAGVLTLFSMLKIWNSLFWGRPVEGVLRPPDRYYRGMVAACLLLTGLSLAIGLGVAPFFALATTAADTALDQEGYVRDVLGIAGKGEGAAMIRGLGIHAFVSLLWLMLQQGGVASLLTGVVLGFVLLVMLRDLLEMGDYVRRVLGIFRFMGIFARELALANLSLARAVLWQPLREIRGDFITYPVEGLSALEIYLLAQCITLTPGTTTVEVLEDGSGLILHAFDGTDPEAIRRGIDTTLRRAILGFTR